ncbi:hypothetical protein BV898_01239 [Hypsibius exemplaris]|uniref:Corticotropin-releasing factor-binding protein n=1 Tax=Hypsibius exemplaris TaxID=2072580 RepID=A0A1W0XCH1_HYPEX|nr:hypothetical protein BV898_01239 [Hypsibius exemplaris]
MIASLAFLLTSCLATAYGYVPDQPAASYYYPNSEFNAGLEKRHTAKEELTECIAMRSDAGIYQVHGTGEESACGLFLVGGMDTQVEIEFLNFDVDCEDGGVVGILDGWEQNGSIFPPVEDMGKTGIRHTTYCGPNRPKQLFRSSGNMALVQYRLPVPGVGFIIRVTYPLNPHVMMMYPEKLTFTYVNVGARDLKTTALQLTGADHTSRHCAEKNKGDKVEVRGGGNFEMVNMQLFQELCGFHPLIRDTHSVMCGATMVRLVSSGHYDNTVIVENELLSEESVTVQTFMCPLDELPV